MSKRKYNSSLANKLRDNGVQALGTLNKKEPTNPLYYYSPDKTKYREIWREYSKTQVCARFVWKNLPNGYSTWEIERMLYFHGTIGAFKIGGMIYFFPYTASGVINPRGFPTRAKPITYNGNVPNGFNSIAKDYDLPINYFGDVSMQEGAILLYDNIPNVMSGKSVARAYLDSIIIDDIVDTMARVNINVVVSNKKIFLVIKDANQRKVVEEELKSAFSSDNPFVLVTSPFEVENIQSTNDFQAIELFNIIKNYDAMRCFMSGISAKGFGTEKKERVIEDELTGQQEEKDLILDSCYDMRKRFCEQINAVWGTNIEVIKRTDIYKAEEQMRIESKEEVNTYE